MGIGQSLRRRPAVRANRGIGRPKKMAAVVAFRPHACEAMVVDIAAAMKPVPRDTLKEIEGQLVEQLPLRRADRYRDGNA